MHLMILKMSFGEYLLHKISSGGVLFDFWLATQHWIGYTILFVLPKGWRNTELPLGWILAHMNLNFGFLDWHLLSEDSVARQTQLLKCLWETSGGMWMWPQQIHFKKYEPMFTGEKMKHFCIIWLQWVLQAHLILFLFLSSDFHDKVIYV